MELDTTLELSEIIKSPNLAEELSEEDLAKIGNMVWDEWQLDEASRWEWEEKTSDAMKLALQVMEEKTFPWENASNVKFPVVTIAALQYQARAYPSLIPADNIVKMKVVGDDPDGTKGEKAERVARYMSYQLIEEDDCWEEHMDKALIAQAIVGCAFKKSYFDPALGHNVSEHVLAKDLYIPYFAKSMAKASRITQILYYSENDLIEKYRMGLFCEYKKTVNSSIATLSSPMEAAVQEAQGIMPVADDPSAPIEILEQHRYLDLDGDGYKEPYIVTVAKDSKQVLRIVARFFASDVQKNRKGEIVHITPTQYFTKIPFIPSPDGGIYDLGFGVLLGPLNQSINTVLNQLIDAGTLAVTAGGFLGRGVKFRSGDNNFKPFEWKRVDSTGDDLRKSVFPLPVREPSPVLFQLLDLLISYTERIGMSTDPMVGENPGQNTPAETSRNMLSEGQRVFNAVFKRTYRALKEEFQKLYKLNGIYMNDSHSYSFGGVSYNVNRQDFTSNPKDICPAADPDMVSDTAKVNQVMMLKAAASVNPAMYNQLEVEKQYLKALKIPNVEQVLNMNPAPPPPDPKVIIAGMEQEFNKLKLMMENQHKIFELQQEIRYLDADIVEKESKAALNLAQAEGIDKGHSIAAMQQAVALMKQKQDGLLESLNILKELQIKLGEKSDAGRVSGMEKTPGE